MRKEQKGMVHVYTGNGKGKTTAALGVALRAAGAGKKVFIGQFVKNMEYSEVTAIRKFLSSNVEISLYGAGCMLDRKPDSHDIECAATGLNDISRRMESGEYDIIILDEVNIAVHLGLLTALQLKEAIAKKADKTEIIITGRYAPKEIIDAADLVTEMQEVKHYYTKGITSRKGIDC